MKHVNIAKGDMHYYSVTLSYNFFVTLFENIRQKYMYM